MALILLNLIDALFVPSKTAAIISAAVYPEALSEV
jgi:hypothetical protein